MIRAAIGRIVCMKAGKSQKQRNLQTVFAVATPSDAYSLPWNDKLLALPVFVRVTRTGSFSAAARELDLSQPSVSRIIAGLEEDVGGGVEGHPNDAGCHAAKPDVGNGYLARVDARSWRRLRKPITRPVDREELRGVTACCPCTCKLWRA